MNTLFSHPAWAMAFRPFYPLAALYGALSILLWGLGYQGTPELPGFYWHAHEMIWGYAGLVVAAFLLTAVATWTGQPPTRGKVLAGLTACWLAARFTIFVPDWGAAASGWFGTLFFWAAAACMALPVWRTKSTRNYAAVFALFVLGGTHAAFHSRLHPFDPAALLTGLQAGLLMVAGFIGLVGTRIISFFTAKRLNVPQVPTPAWMAHAALWLPMISAMLLAHQMLLPLAALCALGAGLIALVQIGRWWQPAVRKEPMLWVLFAGYFFTALGLAVTGIAHFKPTWLSAGVHLIGVGGIGVLTLGMMTRTALGHTGRSIYPPPKSVPFAFWLMMAATLVRVAAAFTSGTAYTHSIRLSAVLFAAALLVYAWRYTPWLLRPRLDGRPG